MITRNVKLKTKNFKVKRNKSLTILSLLFLTSHLSLLTSHFPQLAVAETLSNYNYSIDVDAIDTNPQPVVKAPHEVLGSVTQSLKNEFHTGTNYNVNANNDTFAFSLSQDAIDLGILSGTNPVIRTSQISLTNAGQVLTYENQPLTSQDKTTIPDTTCDDGNCSENTSSPWLSSLTYGFGYRCDSDDKVCDPQFNTSKDYKQYPDTTRNEAAQPAMTSKETNQTASSMITYKVTISSTQKQEGYYNTITYLAIPNF